MSLSSVTDKENKKCKISFIPKTRGSLKPWNIFLVTAGFSNLTESGLVYVLDKNILSKIATSQFNSFSFLQSFWDNNLLAASASHY